MGLITGIITLPLAPVRGVVWIAEQLRAQAVQELTDPAEIRRQLAAVEKARTDGEISDGEANELEQELVRRLWETRPEA